MEFGWPLATGLAVVIAACAVGSALMKDKGRRGRGGSGGERSAEDDAGGPLPYRKRQWILDHGSEREFYAVLEQASQQVLGPCRVMVQVPLSRLIEVEPGLAFGEAQKWRNRIDRKSVDYVVCDAGSLRPRFAVELDGASHDREDRKKRDDFVERALGGAGVALVRVKRWKVSLEEVVGRVRGVVGEAMPVQGHRHTTQR